MKRPLMTALAYCVMTLVLTYPLILRLSSVLPNDAGDPALNTWILWWNAHAVPYTEKWWNAPAFHPIPGVLSFSENLLGLALIATPLQWVGMDPQSAYNVVFLLTFPLCAFGAYLLALELTGRHDAAFIAGLLFGFAPYRMAHFPQIQSLAAFPMPFALLGLHRYLKEPRVKWLVVFASGWLLQGLCNGYYLLFFSVFVGIWMLWYVSPLARLRDFLAIGAAWCVAAVPMLPILLKYRAIHERLGFTRDFGTIRDFGADVAALLHAVPTLAFWGWLRVYKRAEGELFPGLTIVLLIVAGLVFLRSPRPAAEKPRSRWVLLRRSAMMLATVTAVISVSAVVVGSWEFSPFGLRLFSVSNPIKPLTFSLLLTIILAITSPALRDAHRKHSALGFYALGGFLMWLFCLGPAPTLMGSPLMYRGPYSLLMFLPGFNALRVPARFWMMTILCLSVIGAIVFDRLAARLGRSRLALAGLIAAGVLADGWMTTMPLVATPSRWNVEQCSEARSDEPMVEFPLGQTFDDVAAMYRGMSHGRPVVNGYSGYFPPHYAALRFGLNQRDPDMLAQLASHGITDVFINQEKDRDGGWEKYVASHAGSRLVCSEGHQRFYRLARTSETASSTRAFSFIAPRRVTPNVNGDRSALMLDNDRTTRWESGPQTDRTRVDVDLGAVHRVDGFQLELGPFVEDFPRQLVIETSVDGQKFDEVWSGGSAGLAFVGAFEAPQEVPLRYTFPEVAARYARLRLAAEDEKYYWSIAELKVMGR